jgi:hypothetical protein
MITLESTTAERLKATIETSEDPTGTAPEFALTTTTTEPSTWVAGSWNGTGTWNTDNTILTIDAYTPIMGDGQALDTNAATDYDLWIRWYLSTQTPVKHLGRIRIT